MGKIILKQSGNERQYEIMEKKLNQDKIRQFYRQIIECYKPQIKESYWGNEDYFIDLVEQGDKSTDGEDSVTFICKNGLEIKLPRILFDFLFKENNLCTFEHPIGKRYEYENYIFFELIESPIVIINKKIEETGVFPITKNEKENIESCFFIKSETQGKNYDYPAEIIPFFVSQMKDRLKILEDTLPSYFPDHFEPMKYVLKIKNGQENLLIKLFYKLGANLGIIENSVLEDQEIPVQQEIQSILDDENNVNLTNEFSENLDSLKFYISSLRNSNPFYRFLDAYHILESFSFKYFYNYVKNLNSNISKDKLYDEIKKHIKDQQMLKLVLMSYLDNQQCIESIRDNLREKNIKELARRIGKNINIDKWPIIDIEKFASKLSDLIYEFRNAIVHSSKSERDIEKIKESPDLTPAFIDLSDIILKIERHVLEKNIEKW